MIDTKVSVNIPVYNVEKYLEKCVQSVMNQTYKNLEIILIDDGSTDNSGTICENLLKRDHRIQLVHQENKGISGARNTGLDMSTGDYICFVDSDDWIDSTMIEDLLIALDTYDADIAACSFREIRHGSIEEKGSSRDVVYSRKSALHSIIDDRIFTNHLWNKLFRKDLFDSVRFPDEKVFEDVYTTYRALLLADKIVQIAKPLYNYHRRNDSLLGVWPIENELKFAIAKKDQLDHLLSIYPEFAHIAYLKQCNQIRVLKRKLIHFSVSSLWENKRVIKNDISLEIVRKYRSRFPNEGLSKREMFLCRFFFEFPVLYKLLYKIMKR